MTGASLAGLGLVAACAAIARIPNLVGSVAWFLALFVFAFACYAVGMWRLAAVSPRWAFPLVLGVALTARAVLAPAPPTLSTDVYRYVWDARVARTGISPYAFAPVDPALAGLRDGVIFPRLNHPTWRTVYPPAAQRFFQAVDRVQPGSVLVMKLAIALAELAGLAVVWGLLRAEGRPPWQAAIYAWNPLVLVEVWASGHLDGVLVPLVAGALWAALTRRHAVAGALLGLAASLKLYPATLLVLLPISAWPAALGGFVAAVFAGYAPGLTEGGAVLGSLPRYVAEEYFNPGLVRSLVDAPAVTLAAGVAWTAVAAITGRASPLAARAVLLVGGLLLLSPNLFPWYAVWLVPFLALAPSAPWIAFTGTVVAAYTFFLHEPWSISGWARAVVFAPPIAGAAWWLLARVAAPRWRERLT
jgi:alpha-1,6-mannosyltransferase